MARVPCSTSKTAALKDFADRIRAARRGRVINVTDAAAQSTAGRNLVRAQQRGALAYRPEWPAARDGDHPIAYLTRAALRASASTCEAGAAEATLAECEALADWQRRRAVRCTRTLLLAYTDAITRDVEVPDTVFEPRGSISTTVSIVELSVLIGTYAMHVRCSRRSSSILSKRANAAALLSGNPGVAPHVSDVKCCGGDVTWASWLNAGRHGAGP